MLGLPGTLPLTVKLGPMVPEGTTVVEVTIAPAEPRSMVEVVEVGTVSIVRPLATQVDLWNASAVAASASPHCAVIRLRRLPTKLLSRQTQAISVPQGVALTEKGRCLEHRREDQKGLRLEVQRRQQRRRPGGGIACIFLLFVRLVSLFCSVDLKS
jgi:hypothetical protein